MTKRHQVKKRKRAHRLIWGYLAIIYGGADIIFCIAIYIQYKLYSISYTV